jgi:hypothetical protein
VQTFYRLKGITLRHNYFNDDNIGTLFEPSLKRVGSGENRTAAGPLDGSNACGFMPFRAEKTTE